MWFLTLKCDVSGMLSGRLSLIKLKITPSLQFLESFHQECVLGFVRCSSGIH